MTFDPVDHAGLAVSIGMSTMAELGNSLIIILACPPLFEVTVVPHLYNPQLYMVPLIIQTPFCFKLMIFIGG